MRSMLFVPADSGRKLARGLESGADALILDLEDSVAHAGKEGARETAAAFIVEHKARAGRPLFYVRINSFDSGLTAADLDVVAGLGVDGLMLPKSESGADVARLSAELDRRAPGSKTAIVAIATETAAALFGMGTYKGVSHRLAGLAWGAEDLSASLGAQTNRDETGQFTGPYQLARTLCLAGAAAANVTGIDTVHTALGDLAGLERECQHAARDGFGAKMAIHPEQVAVINRVFTPSAEAVAHAKAIVEAFRAAGNPGVIAMGGQMLDRPHLLRAEKILARAR